LFSLGIDLFLADRSAQAVPLLHESLVAYRAHNFREGELNALCFGGFARGFSGDLEGARTLLNDSVALSQESGEVYFQGWAMCALGYGSLEGNNIEDAEKFGKLALKFGSQTGSSFIAATAMHMLAWTAARRKQFHRSATLFGAADVVWASIDLQARSFPIWVARLNRYEALTKQSLGDNAYARNYADGRAMSVEAAVNYALDEQRPAARTAGRGGLTRREQEVAELIAQGLTNREIAAQLVIAKRTADTHVDHILTKLDLSNRVQVAAWVAHRRSSS
jgi:non-specific serine/threonine protein kinase